MNLFAAHIAGLFPIWLTNIHIARQTGWFGTPPLKVLAVVSNPLGGPPGSFSRPIAVPTGAPKRRAQAVAS